MQVFNNNLPPFLVWRPDGTLEKRRHIAYTVSHAGNCWEARDAKTGFLQARNYVSEEALHKTMQGMTERA